LLTFWRHYVLALLLSEVGVWAVETLILTNVRSNMLTLGEAARLSLAMNLTSFGIGLVLPV
jgi:hypothetical protein